MIKSPGINLIIGFAPPAPNFHWFQLVKILSLFEPDDGLELLGDSEMHDHG